MRCPIMPVFVCLVVSLAAVSCATAADPVYRAANKYPVLDEMAATGLKFERFYAAQIRRYATVEMTPEEIHQLGREEVARIRAEMEAIIDDVGFEGDFRAFIGFLRTDPQFYAKTPRELLAYASYVAKKVDGRLPALFGRLPRQPYGVAAVPDDIALSEVTTFLAEPSCPSAPPETGEGGREAS